MISKSSRFLLRHVKCSKLFLNHSSNCLNSNFDKLHFLRKFCIKSNPSIPGRQVFVSSSNCIFENLALEDWMYSNLPLADNDYLLMWRSRPALVIGRHQNPWMEANLKAARTAGVDVARRASGGGTVYHDTGNLNMSFLTARSRYNRRANLELVVSALRSCGDADLSINHKDDILLDSHFKLSGTASKLGRVQSYHHLTLLHSLDLELLPLLLETVATGVTSKATRSIPSQVRNLVETLPQVSMEDIVLSLSREFLACEGSSAPIFHTVDPTDETQFPGVAKHKQEFLNWSWIYGKTPKFSVTRNFTGHLFHGKTCQVTVSMVVEKGKVSQFEIEEISQVMEGLVPLTVAFYTEHLTGEELTGENLLKVKDKFLQFCDSAFVEKTSEVHRAATWLSGLVHTCLKFV